MTIVVIHFFEEVYIEHYHRKLRLYPARLADFALDHVVEATPVVKACETVNIGKFFHFLEHLDIVHSRCNNFREHSDRFRVFFEFLEVF